ncbi:MAG: ABC transporter ATP-binding protein [Gracilibacteraceae bacterium]|nr:ABC transporter ATP-binding protein [Gracilibacteraceae bacterium]
MAEALLQISDLSISFGGGAGELRAVDRVSLAVHRSEVLCLVGESGCGKTLTALAILRLLPPEARLGAESEVRFGGRDLLRLPERELDKVRASDIAIIFQDPASSLNPTQTISRQLTDAIRQGQKISRRKAQAAALAALSEVGIPSPELRLKEYPHQLSGGMKQRIMIAMTLAKQPSLLIADEPTTSLDVTVQAQILHLLHRLRREQGTAILFITHDMGVVAQMADRVLVMYAGQVVEHGGARGVFHRPAHPYTQGLLRSVPRPDRKYERLNVIEGSVPLPGQPASMCRFAERCGFCRPLCRSAAPPLTERDGAFARCFRYTEEW